MSYNALEFVSGQFFATPSPQWRLAFNRPLTDWDTPLVPGHWATIKGVATTPATAVSVVSGKVRISNAAYTATDEQVVYAGPPPRYMDSEGFIVAGFTHDLPS